MFEKNEKPGGMLTYGIPSYKLEKDVVEAEIDVIRQMGVEIRCGVEVGKDVTLDELRAQGYKAFYVAIGCQGGRKAGVPGEDAPNVVTAVDFLHKVNAGDETSPRQRQDRGRGRRQRGHRCGALRPALRCIGGGHVLPGGRGNSMPATPAEEAPRRRRRAPPSTAAGAPRRFSPKAARWCGVVFKRCVSVLR